MTKKQYNKRVFWEFDLEELTNFPDRIYSNPDHAEYYKKYQCGEFDWCWEYLLENRHLLSDKKKIS